MAGKTARLSLSILAVLLVFSCKDQDAGLDELVIWEPYNDSVEVAANKEHENPRMRFKLIQSRYLDKNQVFKPLYPEVQKMDSARYEVLKTYILERTIPEIQQAIADGQFTYEDLVRFYLFRIYRYELDNATTLNTVLALNPRIIEEARKRDKEFKNLEALPHPIYGMPVLLKDNINTAGMPTTAGSAALEYNETDDAFIVDRLKENGALILGKVNLSEWAYYLCRGCPVGYSAVGGQTLNPYGRRIFETGGSSSGSGTSVAANYAVGAVGTETSGSILSPSSQNSVVGLKPTIGRLSRSGIVPISSTLDTPGPMTRNTIDNLILFTAMSGKDQLDPASQDIQFNLGVEELLQARLTGKRFGAFKSLRGNYAVYDSILNIMEGAGAVIVEFTPPEVVMDGFLNILNIDMKNDLPRYLEAHTKNKDGVKITGIADAVEFNAQDSTLRIPYGQELFEGILTDSTSAEELATIKENLQNNGRQYFMEAVNAYDLDAVLSINNFHAGYAAVAKFPALTVPMGYKENGEPISLTFIGQAFSEQDLYRYAAAFERLVAARQKPVDYH